MFMWVSYNPQISHLTFMPLDIESCFPRNNINARFYLEGSAVPEFKETVIVCQTLETEETYFNTGIERAVKGA